jgi:hypothetical protein
MIRSASGDRYRQAASPGVQRLLFVRNAHPPKKPSPLLGDSMLREVKRVVLCDRWVLHLGSARGLRHCYTPPRRDSLFIFSEAWMVNSLCSYWKARPLPRHPFWGARAPRTPRSAPRRTLFQLGIATFGLASGTDPHCTFGISAFERPAAPSSALRQYFSLQSPAVAQLPKRSRVDRISFTRVSFPLSVLRTPARNASVMRTPEELAR